MLSNSTKQIVWSFTGQPATVPDVLNCVGSGWHAVVTKLIDDLFELGWDGQLAQIKEKFGGLRFYIEQGDEAVWTRIEQAEKECDKICDACGKPGKLTGAGWWAVRCDEHV